uniref:LuxR C-terminal-related transcriptional regulator n=1 Tax=Paractinoplanes polyasparticus TaxID=2856853 RepID=UPI001C84D477
MRRCWPRSGRWALHVSEATVKTHVAHLMEKLGARDRVHLVLIAHGRAGVDAGRAPRRLRRGAPGRG